MASTWAGPVNSTSYQWYLYALSSPFNRSYYQTAAIFNQPFSSGYSTSQPSGMLDFIPAPSYGTSTSTPTEVVYSGVSAGNSYTVYGGLKAANGYWYTAGSYSFTMPSGPPTTAPGYIQADPLPGRQIYVNWGSVPTATGYRVYAYSYTLGRWEQKANTSNIRAQFTVNYEYTDYPIYVEPYNNAGNGPSSATVTCRSLDETAPIVGTGDFSVWSNGMTSLGVQARATDTMIGLSYIEYYISYGYSFTHYQSAGNYSGRVNQSTNGEFTSWTYGGLTSGYYYTVGVVAVDRTGNRSPQREIYNVRTLVNPEEPTNVYGRASANTEKMIVLQWNLGANSDRVDVYRSLNGGAFTLHAASVTANVPVGGTAFYQVTVQSYGNYVVRFYGKSSDGRRSDHYIDTGTIAITDATPPPAPTLSFVSSTSSSITVRAAGGNTDVGSGWAGYQFYISVPPNTATAIPSGPIQTATDKTITGLQANTQYLVGVRSKDNSGNQSAFVGFIQRTATGRPANWAWLSAKTARRSFNITADEWNAFTSRVRQFQTYKGRAPTAFPTYNRGEDFTAAAYNLAAAAIANLTGTSYTSKARGNRILAADINALRDKLNSIV